MHQTTNIIKEQKPVLILGMHRSGTSCLAGSLEQAGLYLGEVFTRNEFNLKGNRENKQVMALNDAVLSDNGGNWYSPPETVTWLPNRLEELRSIVKSYGHHYFFGVKDPRLLLTIEGWLEILGDVQLVASFRNPKSVAKSLINRNPELGDEDFWTRLWCEYNSRLLALYNRKAFPLINFDLSERDYQKCMQQLIGQLGLGAGRNREVSSDSTGNNLNGIEPFFDMQLRHHENECENTYSASVSQIWEDLNDAAKGFMMTEASERI